jgi:TorA maturation chaperone TorD
MSSIAASIGPEILQTRCAVYRFVRAALDKPTAEQHRWLASDGFRERLERLATEFGVDASTGELVPAEAAGHEARYLACFEVGLPEPPVVLLASHWNRREPVPAVLHEHKLFYNRFGAGAAMDPRESPDHLLNELSFLIHLDELLLMHAAHDAGSLLRGRRDFLARHPARWIGQAAEAAGEKHVPGLYGSLLAILAAALAQDLELTEASLTTENGSAP